MLPMSDDELANKFRESALWGGLTLRRANLIIQRVFELDTLKSARELTRLLAIQ